MSEEQYFDWLHEEQETQPSVGGGAIGLMSMHAAYFVLGSAPPTERLFTFDAHDDEPAAKKKALAKANELGIDITRFNPMRTLVTFQYKDGVLVRDVSGWKDDQVHISGPMPWSDAFKLVNSRRVELGVKLGVKFHGQLTSAEDPNAKEKGYTEKGPDGEDQIKRVKFPGRVFADKDEALQEAQLLGAGGEGVAAPEGWSSDAWESVKDEVVEMYNGLKAEKIEGGMKEIAAGIEALNKTAESYQVEIKFVRNALS